MEAAKAHSVAIQGFCALGANAGLRLGEIVNARWECFEWESRLLHITSDEQFSTKSRKGRSIPLHGKLIETLQPHAENEGHKADAWQPRDRGKTRKVDGLFLFLYPSSSYCFALADLN